MSKIFAFLCGVVAIFMLAATITLDSADAKRIGGGRSFGSRTYMSQPTKPPSSFTQQRQQAPYQQQAVSPSGMSRSGLGGMFGGLLAGTMLGSLLSGGGLFGGAGAGTGTGGGGLMSLIIMGGLAYLAYRFLSAMRRSRNSRGEDQTTFQQNASPYQYQTASGTSQWDALRGSPAFGSGMGLGANQSQTVETPSDRIHTSSQFDADEFLRGAKIAYRRLNESWDKRDLNDIAQFATSAFMANIREQAAEDPTPSNTEIILIKAELADVRDDGNDQIASVFFNVVMREDPRQTTTSDVREIWHFIRNGDGSGNWKVDGIQQVDA